jgi:hypothetical protein
MEMVHLLMAQTDITEQRNGQGREGNGNTLLTVNM